MYDNVSDEAAWLLVLQELADTRPGFALQVSEVGGSVLVHTVHMSLLQFHSFRIHPDSSCDHVDYFLFWSIMVASFLRVNSCFLGLSQYITQVDEERIKSMSPILYPSQVLPLSMSL